MAASAQRVAPPLEVVRRAGAARALLDPLRRTLLQRLQEPGSASTLARQLGLPRQRLNYHLRELEKAGLVSLVEERRRGNCTERLVRSTAVSYLISPEALGALGATPEERSDRQSVSYLMAAAGRAIRAASALERRAREERKRLATLTLEVDVRFGSAAARAAFAEELTTAVARLVARHQHAGPGRTFRFLIAGYPSGAPRSEET